MIMYFTDLCHNPRTVQEKAIGVVETKLKPFLTSDSLSYFLMIGDLHGVVREPMHEVIRKIKQDKKKDV